MKKIGGVEVRIVKGDRQDVKILSKDGEYQLENNTCFKVLVSDDSGKLRKGDLGVVVQAAGFEGNARYLLVRCEALSCRNLQGAKLLFSSEITEEEIKKKSEQEERKQVLIKVREEKSLNVKRFTVEANVLRYSPKHQAMILLSLGETEVYCFDGGKRHEVGASVHGERNISQIRRRIHFCPGCGGKIQVKKR